MTRIGRAADFDSLRELICGLIYPETWREGNSYEALVFGIEGPGFQCLAVEQMPHVHEDIEKLLGLLRDAFVPQVYEAQRRRPVVVPKPATEAAKSGGGMFWIPLAAEFLPNGSSRRRPACQTVRGAGR